MEPILTRLMTSKSFGYLASEQRSAVVQALLLTVVGPSGTTDSERQALRSRLLDLPWAWELCESSRDGIVDRSRELMIRLEDPAILGQTGRLVAKNLVSPALREGVFLMMVLLFHADGGTARQRAALAPVRKALGIAQTREEWIIDQLQRDLTEHTR